MTEAEKTREAIIMKNKEDKMKEQHEKLGICFLLFFSDV